MGGASAPTNSWLEIAVADTGIGIAATDLPRLFQPFVQLETSLTRQEGGAGLGLAMAYRLAALHGGEIRVSSAPGQGSTFTLRLPWREEFVGAEAPPTTPSPRAKVGGALVGAEAPPTKPSPSPTKPSPSHEEDKA